MKLSEIQKMIDDQQSMMNTFSSMGSTLDQMHQGKNQRAAIQVQLESAQMLADQYNKLERMSEMMVLLGEHIERSEISLKARQAIEDKRYSESLRFSKIASWSGAIAAILGAASIAIHFMGR